MRHVAWLFGALLCGTTVEAQAVDYARDVQPILQKHCYSCHGGLRAKSGLRVDHVAFLRQGGDSGPALAATSADSLLIRAVVGGGSVERMPLDAKPLNDTEIATLRAWVDAGAPAPETPLPADPRQHWSFRPPVRPPLPVVAGAAWSQHPIDRFIGSEHERLGLEPAAPAPKHVLLRRVYLDLVGLPPTPSELRAFLADDSPDAYEKVVDQLLASPQYGERWARHWMDVWRYSDWDGYAAEVRESQPHIWRWRDWIIESLNNDKPYDEMVRQMLAADELAPTDEDALRATGYLVRNWYRFNRNVWLEATVEHTSKAFLGITLNCARCHDHMYDPIEQAEYYQFRAIFEPHDVRTDRLPGQADTKLAGLVRVYDAKPEQPTYLFERGSEARPDKEHPLAAGVPRVLGGGLYQPASVPLPLAAYYPGARGFVQQETLAQVQAAFDAAEKAMQAANGRLAEARKKHTDFVAAAKAAPAKEAVAGAAAPAPSDDKAAAPAPAAAPMDEAKLKEAIDAAQAAAGRAEDDLLAAHAELTAVRARLAADRAAAATPPANDAAQLAADAGRAERIARSLSTKRDLHQLESELTAARQATDEAGKKNVGELEKKLAPLRKAHDDAQAALGQPAASYTRLSDVYPAGSTGRRAALARWITALENPLAARVAVNHIWLRHFGSALVPTVFDFGRNGKTPTHPEMLDWLATELISSGWKMKPLHRLIVTSAAYRQASAVDHPGNRAKDPENVYLWRMNPRRMEAEAVRDSTLQVAAGLDTTLYGPDLDPATGLTMPRRSIYFRTSKEKKVTFLEMFDRANVTDCYRRTETIVPQQALAMVNSSLSLAQARQLAGQLAAEVGAAPEADRPSAFVDAAFERVLCRPATAEERATCLEFLTTQTQRFVDAGSLEAFTAGEANAVKPSADPAQRARENLVHVLLNHNDFLTVR